ncbi:DUF488 domain-containing protein [Apibacter raozihei]|uniref:DUF488 domain-containing protein n=1 Tax=Apibacter raozihei TaxID=2500547 RepID=UPI000FE35E4E|nr:DUF488 domain-containing protein [Apibacter raozihei]
MPEIVVKRVYEPYDPEDGYRILVDRLWPRGIKKENLPYDMWAKEVTPSSGLRKWFHSDPEHHWPVFVSHYREELSQSDAVEKLMPLLASHPKITLLYASKNKEQNHALILKDFLDKKMKA